MKSIATFAKKPELIQITLDSEDIIKEFGDSVIFYMKDYQDISLYFEFFRSQTDNTSELNSMLRKIILNEQGEPVISDDQALPITLAVGALSKINETLGKLKTKSLMSETGNPQN